MKDKGFIVGLFLLIITSAVAGYFGISNMHNDYAVVAMVVAALFSGLAAYVSSCSSFENQGPENKVFLNMLLLMFVLIVVVDFLAVCMALIISKSFHLGVYWAGLKAALVSVDGVIILMGFYAYCEWKGWFFQGTLDGA